MNKYIFFCLVLLLFRIPVLTAQAGGHSGKKEVPEFSERAGLPNFFSKIQRGAPLKVAYFGGSITAQPGWRVHSLEWLQQRFPTASFSEIHAAIGGTASDFGVFRLEEHVLLEIEQSGELPRSVVAMEAVADRYRIPSINFGREVCRLIDSKQLLLAGESKELNGVEVFSPDGVHPYPETGHMIYQKVLKRSFEKMAGRRRFKAEKHKLSQPLAPDYFSDARMVDFTAAELSNHWEVITTKDHPDFAQFGKYLTQLGKAGRTGETLTLRFKGTAVGIYDIMGPDAGKVLVEIDGAVRDTLSRFDAYCTYRRINYLLFDHLEDKEHEVIFRVIAEPFDKATILARRESVMENPDDYRENNWYVGKILINGSLVP